MEREIARDLPKLAARVEAAIAEVKQADVTALEARRAFDRAVSAKAEAAYRLTGGIDRLNAQLRETTSPSITAFLSEMHDEWNRALRAFSFAHEHETSPVTGFHRSISRHNTQGTCRRDPQRDAGSRRHGAVRAGPIGRAPITPANSSTTRSPFISPASRG
jgi:hypothetical protein